MEKKDLRERLVDIMHYDGTYSTSDLVKFIQQELDRAREEGVEEGYQKCMDDIWEEARGLRSWTEHDGNVSAADIEAGLQEAYLNIESSRK